MLMSFNIGAKNSVDLGLILIFLVLEPIQHIRIKPK